MIARKTLTQVSIIATMLFSALSHADVAVKITPNIDAVDIKADGKTVSIKRNQDQNNTIHPKFQLTSRKCPPFCIQPIKLKDGVETVGEVEFLDYLARANNGDDSILVIDSRGINWLKRGTIPGSVNIHYKKLSLKAASEESIAEIFEDTFNVQRTSEFWNFGNAKTLVLYCNGMWCGQAPTNIKSLIRLGYPASKLKWYRGGMQSWQTLGLSTVVPENIDELIKANKSSGDE